MKPILFNTEMTRAIREGRKTQTRRVVKHDGYIQILRDGTVETCADGGFDSGVRVVKSPYGQPGDRLYVRETWSDLRGMGFDKRFEYRANCLNGSGHIDVDVVRIMKEFGCKWRPSIHMPREAARLFLKITAVRVERLQDMHPADCIAEGIPPASLVGYDCEIEANKWDEWITLWDSLAKPGEQWDDNPWVWAYEFRRLLQDEAERLQEER